MSNTASSTNNQRSADNTQESAFPPALMPGPYPYSDTDDLFSGADLHPELLSLLPFVGLWRGMGKGGYPTMEDYTFAQEVRISHDGRPFLAYESRMWRIDNNGEPDGPAGRETGWFRVNDDEVELVVCQPDAVAELYLGTVDGVKLELATDVVIRSEKAHKITANHRLYGIVDDMLCYAIDMAAEGHSLTPHLSARLLRVRSANAPAADKIVTMKKGAH